jgi:hypothetical protein
MQLLDRRFSRSVARSGYTWILQYRFPMEISIAQKNNLGPELKDFVSPSTGRRCWYHVRHWCEFSDQRTTVVEILLTSLHTFG